MAACSGSRRLYPEPGWRCRDVRTGPTHDLGVRADAAEPSGGAGADQAAPATAAAVRRCREHDGDPAASGPERPARGGMGPRQPPRGGAALARPTTASVLTRVVWRL